MKIITILLVFVTTTLALGQATKTKHGNWNQSSTWASNNIGDLVTEDVTVNADITSTVDNGDSFVVGNLVLSQNAKLYINSGGVLHIGDAANSKDLITGQNVELYVYGDLTIWGNMKVPQNLVLKVSGTLTIKSSLILDQNANLEVLSGGKIVIGQDFIANKQNTNVNIQGTGEIIVGGNVSVKHGSNLNTPYGQFRYGGSCDGQSPDFCNNAMPDSILPIELIYFTVSLVDDKPVLEWKTATESNNHYFTIERSGEDLNFIEVAQITGAGDSKESLTYQWTDNDNVSGVQYYRLSQTDYDEKKESFNIVRVNLEYYLVEGFKINDDEKLISYSYFDFSGKEVNSNYSGLKVLLIVTSKTKYSYKIK